MILTIYILDTCLWYNFSHTILKEKDMPEARACHLQNSRVLFCIGIDHHGVETVADMTELGGGE